MNTLHYISTCHKAAQKLMAKDPVKKVLGCVLPVVLIGLIIMVWCLTVTVNRQDSLINFYQTENRELRFALENLLKTDSKAAVIFNYISEAQAIDGDEYKRELTRFEEANPNVPPLNISMDRYLLFLQAMLEVISDNIEKDRENLADYMQRVYGTPNLRPSNGKITSGFGYRPSPFVPRTISRPYSFHSGVDIAGPQNSEIIATADGIVTFAALRGSWGNIVTIDHSYGYQTYYGHLSEFAVTRGESVRRGQVIGFMGSSGNTTGTHLHYEVHIQGQPVNPMLFFPEN